mmetsp:Transcript_62310/g.135284  ORF Transcript_62310/g.135284 Transcript_62310/m.135284 type:complete len:293 (+) Transcript_62310:21-899(+)
MHTPRRKSPPPTCPRGIEAFSLEAALKSNSLAAVKRCLETGMNIDCGPVFSGSGWEPPLVACIHRGCSEEILKYLVLSKASVNDTGYSGLTALASLACCPSDPQSPRSPQRQFELETRENSLLFPQAEHDPQHIARFDLSDDIRSIWDGPFLDSALELGLSGSLRQCLQQIQQSREIREWQNCRRALLLLRAGADHLWQDPTGRTVVDLALENNQPKLASFLVYFSNKQILDLIQAHCRRAIVREHSSLAPLMPGVDLLRTEIFAFLVPATFSLDKLFSPEVLARTGADMYT